MLTMQLVACPYCGENFDTSIDASAGSQDYVEDCSVCCQPIVFHIDVDHAGRLVAVQTRREDD